LLLRVAAVVVVVLALALLTQAVAVVAVVLFTTEHLQLLLELLTQLQLAVVAQERPLVEVAQVEEQLVLTQSFHLLLQTVAVAVVQEMI
jgi:hypothetical protein